MALLDGPLHREGLDFDDGVVLLGVREAPAAALYEVWAADAGGVLLVPFLLVLDEGEAQPVQPGCICQEDGVPIDVEVCCRGVAGEQLLDLLHGLLVFGQPVEFDVLLQEQAELVGGVGQVGHEAPELVG